MRQEEKLRQDLLKRFAELKRSIRVRPLRPGSAITGQIVFPDLQSLQAKTYKQLVDLRPARFDWDTAIIYSFGMSLADGQSCKAGTRGYSYNLVVDDKTRITKVDVYIRNNEQDINQIIFYGENGVVLASNPDEYGNNVRKETIEIAADE